MIEQRKCTGACGEWLPLSMFHKDPTCAGGLRNDCKGCHNAAKRERYRRRYEHGRVTPRRPIHPVQLAGAGMTRVLGIDPGTHESGYCLYDGKVITSGVMSNADLLKIVADDNSDVLAIEKIVSYGSAVGQETFDTCIWIGRFMEAWGQPDDVMLIPRRSIKKQVCGPGKWGDPDVRSSLIKLVGEQGSKKQPGPTYGVKSHAWSALACAYTALAQLS